MDTNKENLQNEGTLVAVKAETKAGIVKKVLEFGKKVGRGIKRAATTKVGRVVTYIGGATAAGYVGYKMGQRSVMPAQITIKTDIPEETSTEEIPVEEPELGEIQEDLDTELSEL